MDLALFASLSLVVIWHQQSKPNSVDEDNNNNEEHLEDVDHQRSTFILVMHEPPHMFYEPKEWSNTACLMKRMEPNIEIDAEEPDGTNSPRLALPGGPVCTNETFEKAAIRELQTKHKIDVHEPQNCLHHLFSFPLELIKEENGQAQRQEEPKIWGDFYEVW